LPRITRISRRNEGKIRGRKFYLISCISASCLATEFTETFEKSSFFSVFSVAKNFRKKSNKPTNQKGLQGPTSEAFFLSRSILVGRTTQNAPYLATPISYHAITNYRALLLPLPHSKFLLRQRDRFLEDLQALIHFRLRDGERRGDADDALGATEQKQATLEGQVHNAVL
jgi:hypothetical protein